MNKVSFELLKERRFINDRPALPWRLAALLISTSKCEPDLRPTDLCSLADFYWLLVVLNLWWFQKKKISNFSSRRFKEFEFQNVSETIDVVWWSGLPRMQPLFRLAKHCKTSKYYESSEQMFFGHRLIDFVCVLFWWTPVWSPFNFKNVHLLFCDLQSVLSNGSFALRRLVQSGQIRLFGLEQARFSTVEVLGFPNKPKQVIKWSSSIISID